MSVWRTSGEPSTLIVLLLCCGAFNTCYVQGTFIGDEPIRLINVEVKMPWYIEFAFPPTAGLQPSVFDADLYSDGVKTSLPFFLERHDQKWVFRNTNPYTFKVHDIIAGRLEFTIYPEERRWIPVYYTITRNRRYDALTITESRENIQSTTNVTTGLSSYGAIEPQLPAIPPKEANQQATPSVNSCRQEFVSSSTQTDTANAVVALTSNTYDKITALQKEVDNLKEIVQSLMDFGRIGTRLILTGSQPPGTNPVEAIRHLITDKLQLSDLTDNILQAEMTSDGIRFEMASPSDKVKILTNSAKYLQKSPYTIRNIDEGVSCFNAPSMEPIKLRLDATESPHPKLDVRSSA